MIRISFKKRINPHFIIIFLSFFGVFGSPASPLNDMSYLKRNYSQVRSFENYLFKPPLENPEELINPYQIKTHSALILKDGKIIYEKYAEGYDKDRPHKMWSISKAITSLLIGIAVKENRLSLKDNVCRYFKKYTLQFNCKNMTIEDLMGWSSGLRWKERDFPSSTINMLYTSIGYKDSTSFILKHSLAGKPGELWHYSSADTNLLTYILSQVYKSDEYAKLPWIKLFNELDVQNATWEKDHKGIFQGCCSLYLTSRDLARVGEFMLEKGNWLGKDFLPKDWIKNYVQTTSPSFLKEPIFIRGLLVPSFQWWINKPSFHKKVFKPRAISAPDDLFAAVGYAGQYFFIIPSMNTVIIRTGPVQDIFIDINAIVGLALGIITGKQYVSPIRTFQVPYTLGEEFPLPLPQINNNFNSAQMINNYVSKELCSCLFVEKGTKHECLDQLEDFIKNTQVISSSYKNKTVKVSHLGFLKSTSHYSKFYGCRIQ